MSRVQTSSSSQKSGSVVQMESYWQPVTGSQPVLTWQRRSSQGIGVKRQQSVSTPSQESAVQTSSSSQASGVLPGSQDVSVQTLVFVQWAATSAFPGTQQSVVHSRPSLQFSEQLIWAQV